MIFAAFYIIYYAVIELPGFAGLLAALLVFCGYIYANFLYNTRGDDIWSYALYTHIACWIAQFLGHGVWEGRSPALLDNLYQAFAIWRHYLCSWKSYLCLDIAANFASECRNQLM